MPRARGLACEGAGVAVRLRAAAAVAIGGGRLPLRNERPLKTMSDDPLLEANYDPRQDGAVREGQKLARPRHAATLIIVRRDAKKPRLLMGRRAGGHAFMPSKWVFPGGRIDRTDFTA